MTKDDYDSEAADLLHCSRCFHRFRLPSDWGVQDAPAHAVDSDSSVSLSSLTDSSVDTASDSEKILLQTKREATSSRMTLVQQAHKHPPRFVAENHQELGVPQIAHGL